MTATWESLGIDVRNHTSGEVKTTCPKCSSSRKKKRYPCLNVNLDKELYNCWHCGWRGSLGRGEESRPNAPKVWRKPEFVTNHTDLPENVVSFFAHRGIGQQTLLRNQIGHGKVYFPQVEAERTCITFPYFRGGECINVKYRTPDKLFRLASGAERILYGLDDITETLIWVEGEMDKLSVEEAGFTNCVSVPDGAPAPDTRNYDSKFDFLGCEQLARVKQHIIAVDNDAPGRRLQEELIRRLGPDRCKVVTWSSECKDANDVLLMHGPGVVRECIEAAVPVPIEGTCTINDLWPQIVRRQNGEVEHGCSSGWKDLDGHYKVLAGEWTLVTGIPGHGKSEWLDALTMNLAVNDGWNIGVFSPENHPPEDHGVKMMEKYVGKPFDAGPNARMSLAEADEARAFIDEHFTFLMPENPSLDTLLEQAGRLVTRKGINGLILDPWNEIDHVYPAGQTETQYISTALSKIRRFCWTHKVHAWIVAHPTKLRKEPGEKEYPVPTPYDVSGAAHWRNKADNCITVYRSMKEETQAVQIHVQKIRKKRIGKVGAVELRYDKVTGRYHDWGPTAPVYSFYKQGQA